MAIIHQLDKRSGITYAYESHSYWDREKKMSRAKRVLIGRVDTETGEITPTDGRGRKSKEEKEEAEKEGLEKLCEKLRKKCAAQDALIAALKKENAKLKDRVQKP
jgi:peptidoglycan hydrolase CwlO-like protein